MQRVERVTRIAPALHANAWPVASEEARREPLRACAARGLVSVSALALEEDVATWELGSTFSRVLPC